MRSVRQSGSALIVVMWLMVLLGVVVAHFSREVHIEASLAANCLDRERAYYLARSGIELAILEISKDEAPLTDTLKDSWSTNRNAFGGQTLGQGEYIVEVTDEESKINLNTADAVVLSRLLYAMEVDRDEREELVACILDWRDEDDKHKLNGAESDYYEALDPPYVAKDGLFDSVDELLLVKGVTTELFWGHEGEEGPIPGLVDLLTIHQSEPGVNVNTAPPQVLEAVLGVGKGTVDAIVDFRDDGGYFNSTADLANFGVSVSDNTSVLTFSRNFSIISTGILRGGRVRRTIKAVVSRETGALELRAWNDLWRRPARVRIDEDEEEEA